jgi:hypothetical protein
VATNIKPTFQVEYLEGTFFRTVMAIEEEVRTLTNASGERKIITRRLVPRREEFHDGYMLWFPQGHSLFIAGDDREQLERLGVLDTVPRVDMESGEKVPEDFHLTPKEIVQRKTQNRPRPPGAVAAVGEQANA